MTDDEIEAVARAIREIMMDDNWDYREIARAAITAMPVQPSADVERALAHLRLAIVEFENKVEQAWEREDRPDLWDHVVEIPIPSAKAILGALNPQEARR